MKGILTIAVGEPLYGRMAVALAVSIKQNSRTPIGIIYSKSAFKGLEDYLAVFDHHILIEDNVTPNKQVMELKVSLDLMTPYHETLFLDADTIINPSHSVDEMFLQSSDFTMFNIGISPLSGEPSSKYRALVWFSYLVFSRLIVCNLSPLRIDTAFVRRVFHTPPPLVLFSLE